MKTKYVFFAGLLLGMTLVAAFTAGAAYASTGCFSDTNGNWAETYICWLKDNGISTGTGGGNYSPNNNVTRAEMAVFLQRQAEVPPSTGNMYISAGLTSIQPNGNFNNAYVKYYTDAALLRSSALGNNMFVLSPAMPASLYGRQLLLSGVQVCYDATHGAALNSVEFMHYAYVANTQILLNDVVDIVSRSDKACRTYSFASPSAFYGTDHATLLLEGNFASVLNSIDIFSVTFILSPSASAGNLSLPAGLERPFDPALNPAVPGAGETGQ